MNTTTGNAVMPLTNAVIRKAKSEAKPYSLTDEQGLYLPVNRAPRYFLWDCRFAGKRLLLLVKILKEKKKNADFWAGIETMGRSKERE
jgi:hypothetical protein